MSFRVAIFTQHGPWSPSTRSRALQHATRLADEVDVVEVYPADDRPYRGPGTLGQVLFFSKHGVRYVSRYREVSRVVSNYDALFIQRGLYSVGPGAIVRAIERYRGHVVFDLDDALYGPNPAAEGKGRAARWLYGPQQALRLLARADDVVVSTEAVGDGLPMKKRSVTVLPSVPEVHSYEQAVDGGTPGLIGWAGTNGGIPYLDPLEPVFRSLLDDGVGRLRVVSSTPWSGPSQFQEWRLEDETRMFAAFGVGIMPLPDSEYARAKAGYKLLQYMSAGVPIVASPVGVNRELVEQSGAGFLADRPSEWEEALRTLLEDRNLRIAMGQAGRAYVEKYADPAGQVQTLARLLRRGMHVAPER